MLSPAHLGRYELLRPLGRGGMGEVYLARQAGPAGFSKTVVVKRILPHRARDVGLREMFLNEARIAAGLSHPNIVQIFDLGHERDDYWIAMEYVHGRTLDSARAMLAARAEAVPAPIAAAVTAQVLRGLHYAHQHHVVHRDVSPDNVLVAFNGAAKLLDFGIAKARATGESLSGPAQGKVAYIAPEQLKGEPVDFRADVYATGAMLNELLTGTVADALPTQQVSAADPQTPAAASLLAAGLPAQLGDIIARALAPSPRRRFATAAVMADELEAFVRASGTIVGPPQIAQWMEQLFGVEAAREDSLSTHQELGPSTQELPERDLATGHAASRRRRAPTLLMALAAAAIAVTTAAWALLARPATPSGGAAASVATDGLPKRARASPPPTPDGPLQPAPASPPLPTSDGLTQRASAPSAFPAPAPSAPDEAPKRSEPTPAAVHPPKPAPPKRAPHPPAVVAPGMVDVRIVPWAEVELDGRSLGMTPFPPVEVPAGPHTFTLRNPKLGIERRATVMVHPGATTLFKQNLLEGGQSADGLRP